MTPCETSHFYEIPISKKNQFTILIISNSDPKRSSQNIESITPKHDEFNIKSLGIAFLINSKNNFQ